MRDALSSADCCEIDEVRWWLRPGESVARARPVLREVLRQLAGGAAPLKRGRRKALYRLALPGTTSDHLLKVNRYDRGVAWTRRIRPSKARRELAVAIELRARGIETPLPLAAGEVRQRGFLTLCYLLVPVLDGFEEFSVLWRARGIPRAERRAWIRALGRLSRRLHDAGLLQEDFAPNNFLLRRSVTPEILPIDFERARFRRALGTRPRGFMLAKLDRHMAGASATERLRFLRAYAGEQRESARFWWRRVSTHAARLAMRDLAHLRRTSTRDSRRFQRVAWGDWRGWALREAEDLALAASRTRATDAPRLPETGGALVAADGALWRGYGSGSRRAARRLWSTAILLWARGGLIPRPIACVTRGDEWCIWFARPAGSQTLLELSHSPAARGAAIVLVDRLLAIGRLDPWLSPRKIALLPRPDGAYRAQLLDPSAFRTGRALRRKRRERARSRVGDRLKEIQQLIEIIEETSHQNLRGTGSKRA